MRKRNKNIRKQMQEARETQAAEINNRNNETGGDKPKDFGWEKQSQEIPILKRYLLSPSPPHPHDIEHSNTMKEDFINR